MEAAYPKSRSPFLEQVRAAIRARHYGVRTERAYIDWIVRSNAYRRDYFAIDVLRLAARVP
jgi:hypothetical protein